MNNSRKYAEGLVGPLDRSIYNTQRDVAQQTNATNWEKIQNQYKNLTEQLKQRQEQANKDFNNGLVDVSENSFNRLNNINTNLVNRGLTTSGINDVMKQADTTAKGEEVLNLLSKAGNVAVQGAEQLKSGNETVASKEADLGKNLSDTLGNIGARETQAQMNYNSVLADIAGAKDTRDMENALAAAQRAAQAEATRLSREGNGEIDQRLEEYTKRKTITQILAGINPEDGSKIDWDDSQKAAALKILFDVKNADDVVKNYNDNLTVTETNKTNQEKFDKQLKEYENNYGKLDVETERLLRDLVKNNGNYNPFLSTTAPAQFENPMTKQSTDEQVQSLMAALGKVEDGEIPSKLLSLLSYPNLAKEGDIKDIIDKYQSNVENNPFASIKDWKGDPITNGSPYNKEQFNQMNKEIMPIAKDRADYDNIMALNELKNKMNTQSWEALINKYNDYNDALGQYNSYKDKGPSQMTYKDLEMLLYGNN